MKVKVNDQVMVMRGKSKGKTAKVLRVDTTAQTIQAEKVHMIVKHKKKKLGQPGERLEKEGFVHASNVMVVCPSCKKATRVGYGTNASGKKVRQCKKCKALID